MFALATTLGHGCEDYRHREISERLRFILNA
jgi:hypothetical protein